MARGRVNTIKYEIIQEATRLFLVNGYSATSPKMIADALDISTGNLTYYFPTKEHLLAVLVDKLCSFQGGLMQSMVEDEGKTPLLAICLELAAMASMCDQSEIAKDFLISAYASPMCLEIIRENDTHRSKFVYGQYCPDWNDQRYAEAEILVSGIEYATMMDTNDPVTLDARITGALNSILQIYNVPEDIRTTKIKKVLAMDFRGLGSQVLAQFKSFVEQSNEQVFHELQSPHAHAVHTSSQGGIL